MKTDQTRYQILLDDGKIENFTAAQKRDFDRCVKSLKAAGVKFTTWDTRRNALASLLRF
jgi:hypothetical protein